MDGTHDYQAAALVLLAAFEVHDRLGLARATVEQREEQGQARLALFGYLTRLWGDLKVAGEHPGDERQYASIAALRDLCGGQVDNAHIDPP